MRLPTWWVMLVSVVLGATAANVVYVLWINFNASYTVQAVATVLGAAIGFLIGLAALVHAGTPSD